MPRERGPPLPYTLAPQHESGGQWVAKLGLSLVVV